MFIRITTFMLISLIIISACMSNKKQVSFVATVIQGGQSDLYELSSDKSSELVAEDVTCVNWSADGTRIAYSSAGNIIIRDLTHGTEDVFEINFWQLTQPTWSPGGSRLAFKGRDKPETTDSIWLMDIMTGKLEKISDCQGNEIGCFISVPDWSTDNRIVYGVRIGENQNIVEYNLRTGEVEVSYPLELSLTTDSHFGNDPVVIDINNFELVSSSVAWSPDRIYLAMVDNGIRSNVHVLNTHTQEIVNVTQSYDLSVAYDSPTWSSDGQWLLLRRLHLRQYDFWEIVGYNLVLTNVTSGLSSGKFHFDTVYESNDPIVCPGNLAVE